MAWPTNVTAGQSMLASQYNALVSALQTWGGAVSAAGNTLSNLGGLAFTGSPAVTFPGTATFSVAPVFTDQAGSRTALGLGSAAVVSAGNLTEATSAVLTITGGTGGTLGNVTVQVKQASASQSGYLSSTDWSTFNSKQAALTLPLSIANGGTGQGTAAAALTALGGASLAANNTFSGNQSCPQITSNNYFTGTSANVFWLQSVASGVFFNTWNGSNWFQTANITASSGLWTFQQSVTFSIPANISFGTVGANWQTWTPTVNCSGSMTITGITLTKTQYLRVGPFVFFEFSISGTLGGSLSNTINVSMPVALVGANTVFYVMVSTSVVSFTAALGSTGSVFSVNLNGLANYPAGAVAMQATGFYRVAS